MIKRQVRTTSTPCEKGQCTDLYLITAEPLNGHNVRLRFTASADLDSFVADDPAPAKLAGPRQIEMLLPPWSGRARLSVGRAVSKQPVDFKVEVVSKN